MPKHRILFLLSIALGVAGAFLVDGDLWWMRIPGSLAILYAGAIMHHARLLRTGELS